MGRTKRIRQRSCSERELRPFKVDFQPEFVKLCKWMTSKGWKAVTDLCPAVFWGTGRGLMAMSNIPAKCIIIKIPEKLLITKVKVLNENPGLQQFSMSTAECLTFFILNSKMKGLYKSYLSTFPTSFSVGGLCKTHEVEILPLTIQEKVLCQQEYVLKKYQKFVALWKKLFCLALPLELFQWAWFAVNTRAVFFQDTEKTGGNGPESNMALAPYLDMFNHDAETSVEAGFDQVSRCYEIRTNQKIKKYDQVFINYGPHSNQKLFLEYGFITSNNVHSTVEFDIRHILDIIPTKKILPQQLTLLSQLSRSANLFVSQDGFSWGAQIAFTILTLDNTQLSTIDSPFQISPCNSHETGNLSTNLVNCLTQELLESLKKANETCYDTSKSFTVARSLIREMICLLNKHELFTRTDLYTDSDKYKA